MRARKQARELHRVGLVLQHRAQIGDRRNGLVLLQAALGGQQQRGVVPRVLGNHLGDEPIGLLGPLLR